jgi:hypothetical protein
MSVTMHGNELTDLIDLRWSTLNTLLELGRLQTEAIQAGRMSDLMRILSEKQAPLNRLSEIAESLRAAAHDDPSQRLWDSEAKRQDCRLRQEQCDQMHTELLAIEAACESALQENRSAIQRDLDQLNASHQAASRYAPQSAGPTSGSQLDLSE